MLHKKGIHYFQTLNNMFENKTEFSTLNAFCEHYNVGRSFTKACIELGIFKKHENGNYYVSKKVTYNDINKIQQKRIFYAKNPTRKNTKITETNKLVMLKNKGNTYRDIEKKTGMPVSTIHKKIKEYVPTETNKAFEFSLFWGLIKFKK